LIVEIIGIVLAFNFNSKLEGDARERITTEIKQYNWNQTQQLPAIDNLQKILKCCGANSYEDWNSNLRPIDRNYPFSCCDGKLNDSVKCTVGSVNNTIGCVQAIKKRLNNRIITLGSVSILVSILQVAITIMACMLGIQIRKYESF